LGCFCYLFFFCGLFLLFCGCFGSGPQNPHQSKTFPGGVQTSFFVKKEFKRPVETGVPTRIGFPKGHSDVGFTHTSRGLFFLFPPFSVFGWGNTQPSGRTIPQWAWVFFFSRFFVRASPFGFVRRLYQGFFFWSWGVSPVIFPHSLFFFFVCFFYPPHFIIQPRFGWGAFSPF